MAIVDPSEYEPFCKLFPELTDTQTINTCLYSSGATHKEIAELRRISANAVRQSLSAAQKNLGLFTSSELRSVFMTRLMIDMYLSINKLNK